MDEYETIYLLDEEDMRNAREGRRSHRPDRPGLIRSPWNLGRPRPTRVVRPAGPTPVVVAQPVAASSGGVFGNLDRGELVEIAAQVLSAVMPLPAAPAAVGDVRDVANQTLYMTARATHAKRAEQLRTLGSVIGKLLD